MTPAFTPDAAVDWLADLETDIRESIVLDGQGRRLAGSPALAAPAAGLLATVDALAVEIVTERGAVYAARSASHGVVVVCGRFVLPALILYDLRHVLEGLEAA